MRIQRIISGAQTGADRAALDFAVEYGIDHGGWVPKGRRAEDGTVPARYHVRELPEGGYPERTEKNVIDSDGTLIISHGKLTGGSFLTLQMTEKHQKPCLSIDLRQVIIFDAAIDIHDWITENRIGILNVAGPRASKDPEIYDAVHNLLETVFHLDIITDVMPGIIDRTQYRETGIHGSGEFPRTVTEAVDELMQRVSAIDKMRIASARPGGLGRLEDIWGEKVHRLVGLRTGNTLLVKDCRLASGDADLDAESAALVILRAFHEKLRASGHLRIVK